MRISSEGVRIAMYGAMLEKVAPSDENWELSIDQILSRPFTSARAV